MIHPAPIFNVNVFAGFDTETFKTEATVKAPRLVCGSIAKRIDGVIQGAFLYPASTAIEAFEAILDEKLTLVNAFCAFDLAVIVNAKPSLLPRVFEMLDDNRVFDVLIGQTLDSIARGCVGKSHGIKFANLDGSQVRKPSTGKIVERYSLEVVVHQLLGRADAKSRDVWKLRYDELDGLPFDELPLDAVLYPIDDAKNALEVAIAMVTGEGKVGNEANPYPPGPHRNLEDMSDQVRAHFAEYLACMQGLNVDLEEVARYEAEVVASRVEHMEKAKAAGFYRLGGTKKEPKFTKDTKAVKRALLIAHGGLPCDRHEPEEEPAVEYYKNGKAKKPKKTKSPFAGCDACKGTGIEVPAGMKLTDTGDVSADREVLEDCDDPAVQILAELGKSDKAISTYIPYLRSSYPTIHPNPNVLLATGRSSYDGAMQQMPRSGRERACFYAPPGKKLLTSDWGGIEAVTWSQSCLWLLGHSRMAQAIVDGRDVHVDTACELMGGLPYDDTYRRHKAGDEEVKKYRQLAKVLTFGLPGGMGALRLVESAKAQKVVFCRSFGCETCQRTVIKGEPVCRNCFEIATALKRMWYDKWDAKPYFDRVTEIVDSVGEVPTLVPNSIRANGVLRMRGGVEFSAACNNFFQSLAAAGAKASLWEVTKRCWLMDDEDLLGWSVRFFMHDEFLLIGPEERAERAKRRVEEIMVSTMQRYVPDVASGVKVESKILDRWQK